MKRMVIPFLAAFVFFMSSFNKAQAVTLDKPHDFTCATCHTPHKTLDSTGYNNICLNCHRGGDPMAGAKSFAPGDAADPFNKYTSGVSNRFQISHRWDGADINTRAGATAPTQAQMTSVRGRTSGAMACVRCHNPHSQANKPFLRTANSNDQMCTDCHSSRNQTDHKTGTHPVGIDYQQKAFANLSGFKTTPVNSNSSNPTSAMKLVGGKILCSTCHSVHATDSNSATFDSFSTLSDLQPSDGNLLRTDRRAATAAGLNICTNCHTGKVAHDGRGQNVQCTDCHGAHVDTGDGSVPNVWLVKRDMGAGKGTVQFTSTTVKNYMGANGSNGVCQSCHAVPTGAGFQFHLTETNATCNNCHTHGNSKGAFTVDATGACNACHGYPPLLNSAGPGGYAAGYNSTSSFVDESTSGHGSHVSSPYQKACSSCHSGNSHVTGTYQDVFVGTVNYDKAAQTCSNVYCHSNANPRGGTNITKTTPSWKGAKGKLLGAAGECGACHNAAGDSSPSWSASHTRHINGYAANAKFNCNACHAKTAASNAAIFSNMTALSLHTNGVKDVAFNSFAGGGSWDSGSATCSNLYCHSNVQGVNGTGAPTTFTAATWNGAAMTCGSCHASMTTDIATVTGNHKLHVQGYGFDCSTCHGAGYSATGNTAPASTHVDGSISMSFTGKAAINGANPSYYQGNNIPGDGYKNCANIYCHSNVQGSGGTGSPTSFASPDWGTSPLICGSCHANMATSGAATGSHKQHAQTAGISCVTCHNGAGKDPNPPYASTAKHANGSIDISFSGSAVGTAYSKGASVNPGAGYGSCSTVSCHANPYGTAPLLTAPVWGSSSAGCATCHSGSGAFGAYSSPATGSHVKHIAGTGVLCNQCHVGAVKGTNGGTGHANGVVNVDVALGYYSSSIIKHAAGTYSVNAKCSTAVCHSDPYSATQAVSPVWGTPSGCESCHNNGGAFTGTDNGPATGSHKKHMAATALSVSCGACHTDAVAGTKGGPLHTNGVVNVDVTLGYYSSSIIKHAAGTYSANAKCSTICHSPYTTPVTTPVWGTASNCSSCHELAPTTGSHGTHLSRLYECSECHAGALSNNNGGASHLNGSINVTNGYPVTAKHTANTGYTGTCSAASCHSNPYAAGSITTPVWGATAGCAACHTVASGGAITTTGPATGSHAKHNNTDCSQCHASATTSATSPTSNHADGNINVNVALGYPATVAKHTINTGYTGTCSTASCHSNPYAAGSITTPVWGATSGCAACHTVASGGAITTTGPATGSHAKHNYTDCSQCHASATTSATAPTLNHADGNINVNVALGYPAIVAKHTINTGYSGTCTTTICHGTSSPVWGANTANATCTKCHGTPSTIDSNANRAPAIGAHQVHVRGAGSNNYSRELTCTECHNSGTTVTFTNHMNGNTQNVVFTNASTASDNSVVATWTAGTYPNGTCAVYCHGSSMPRGDTSGTARTPSWTANLMTGVPANDCSRCHGNPPTTGTTATTHIGKAATTSCVECHSHFNAAGGFDSEANRRLHINGTVEGGGCDGCHSYDNVGSTYAAGEWSGGTWGKNPRDGLTPNEGYGAHAVHINYIKNRLGIATVMNPASQAYGAVGTNPANVCGTCHSNLVANHITTGSTVRSINFGDDTFKMGGTTGQSLLFGTTNPVYNGTSGVSSATIPKTCSNLSCHYFTTPLWSTY